MAQRNLEEIVERLRRLSPEKLRRVGRVIDELENRPTGAGGFERLCGVLPEADANAMMDAVAECDRIDAGEW